MRFAKVTPVKPEPARHAASDFLRKLMASPRSLPEAEAAAKVLAELPLDQRVRLVGEW